MNDFAAGPAHDFAASPAHDAAPRSPATRPPTTRSPTMRRLGACLAAALAGAWLLLAAAPHPPTSAHRLPAVPATDTVPAAAPSDTAAARAAPGTSARDTSARDTVRRATVAADSLSAVTEGGQRLQRLFGNVRVRQDSTRLRARRAVRFLEERRYLFLDDVVIYERGDTIYADTVRYDERRKIGRATGRVRLTDGDVIVLAPEARYFADAKRSVFEAGVTLVDSVSVLTSRRGVYFSEAKRAEFAGQVELRDLSSYLSADSVVYFRADDRSEAFGRVFVERFGEREERVDRAAARDTTRRTLLFGDTLRTRDAGAFSRTDGRALLVQLRRDTAAAADDDPPPPDTARAAASDTAAASVAALLARDTTQLDMAQADSVQADSVQADSARTASTLVDAAPDTAAAAGTTDTLLVAARALEARRRPGLRRLIAIDSVRIWQPRLAAVADSAVYDRITDAAAFQADVRRRDSLRADSLRRGLLRPDALRSPRPDTLAPTDAPADTTRSDMARSDTAQPDTAQPDTARSDTARSDTARSDTARSDSLAAPPSRRAPSLVARLRAAARAQAARPDTATDSTRADSTRADSLRAGALGTADGDAPALEETRLFQDPVTWFEDAQVTGDTIRVFARARSVDTIFVRGQAFAAQLDTTLGRIQQLSGRTLTAYFRDDALRRLTARPNARAVRFLQGEDAAPNGAARASGDRIDIYVVDGEVGRVVVRGGVEGTYYDEAILPDPLRLDGFSWTPARAPVKATLLDARARRRLAQRPRPLAAPPYRLPLDTLRRRFPPPPPLPDSLRRRARRPPPDTLAPRDAAALPDTVALPDSLAPADSLTPLVPASSAPSNRESSNRESSNRPNAPLP